MRLHATRLLGLTTLTLVLSAWPGSATAQETDPPEKGVYIGPVALTPRAGWQGLYDDNVFRSSQNPISDFVSILTADSDIRLQVRRVAVSGSALAQWEHFTNLVEERGANLGSSIKVDFMLNKIAPYAAATYENTQARQYQEYQEFDSRPRSEQFDVTLGSAFRFSDRTSLIAAATHSNVAFDNTDFEDDVNLAAALDRTSNHYALTFRQGVTPLTYMTLGAELDREYFQTSTYRNGEETRFSAGFESDGFLKGYGRAGYRRLRPHDPSVPDYSGLFVSVGTNMTLRDRFQIGVNAKRGTEPSYREGVAYFDASGYSASLTYAMRPSISLRVGAGLYFADYTDGSAGLLPSALQYGVEKETRYDSGLRFDLGQSLSIDLTGAYAERMADIPERRFEGMTLRVGVMHAF